MVPYNKNQIGILQYYSKIYSIYAIMQLKSFTLSKLLCGNKYTFIYYLLFFYVYSGWVPGRRASTDSDFHGSNLTGSSMAAIRSGAGNTGTRDHAAWLNFKFSYENVVFTWEILAAE